MAYLEAIRYLESFVNYEKIPLYPYKESFKLERINGFLPLIGNPQKELRCIHVAGSKGKGSTCAFIAFILRQAGYKTGLYTSPHLSDFRERIRILEPRRKPASKAGEVSPRHCRGGTQGGEEYSILNTQYPDVEFEGMIAKEKLASLVGKLKPTIEKYNKQSEHGPLSFFEVYTALAFTYFKEKKVDFVVLETGLGGRLDATNAADSWVAVITPISYEHTQTLGNTLREIAREKSGIIKTQGQRLKAKDSRPRFQCPIHHAQYAIRYTLNAKHNTHGSIVISAPQEKEAMEVIRNRCQVLRVRLFELGKDILYRKAESGFKVRGLLGAYSNLKINLIGSHQIANAAVAVGAVEALADYDIKISADSIKKGLYDTVWPGRCEVISKEPLIVLDGAQNSASAYILKKAIKENFKYRKLILILGISSDKDIGALCEQLCPLADKIILTQANNPRAASVDYIEGIISSQRWACNTQYVAHNTRCTISKAQIIKTRSVTEALREARSLAKERDLILVTGSLFVVGEVRELFF